MIRAATTADTARIAALEETNLGADAWPMSLVAPGVAGELPTVQYVVAELGGDLAGHAVVSIAGDLAELQRIGVDATHRRTGLASALLDEVARLASVGGADRLLLEVRVDNAGAIAFYLARGFAEISRRPRYYRDGTTAVVLERHL